MFDYWEYVPFLSYYKTVKSILKDHSKFIEIHTLQKKIQIKIILLKLLQRTK